jgi:hypothetical protein
MPYFNLGKNKEFLFIHIPKTGGTSVMKYIEDNHNIDMLQLHSVHHLRSNNENKINLKKIKIITPMDHMIYKTIYKFRDIFQIDLNNANIFTVVRNPYERCISALFYWKLINKNSTKEEVFEKIQMFLLHTKENNEDLRFLYYDNHTIPQYLFLLDEHNEILQNIKIMKTESLNQSMKDYGFNDFNVKCNNNIDTVNYYEYLNEDAIKLINNVYEKDFIIFNYEMITSTEKKNETNII